MNTKRQITAIRHAPDQERSIWSITHCQLDFKHLWTLQQVLEALDDGTEFFMLDPVTHEEHAVKIAVLVVGPNVEHLEVLQRTIDAGKRKCND